MTDDALVNCRSLVELLADAVRRTHDLTALLHDQENALEPVGASLGDTLDGARDEVFALVGGLKDTHARAASGLLDLEESARGQEQAVSAIEAAADELEKRMTGELEEEEREVETAFDVLAEEVVAALEGELALKRSDLVAASNRAAPDLDAIGPAYAAAEATLSSEGERAIEAVRELVRGLEEARSTVGEGWTPFGLLDEIEGAAREPRDEFGERMRAWGLELALAGETLHAGVATLSEDLGNALAASTAAVEDAEAALEDERPRLALELEQVQADLEAGRAALDAAITAAARAPGITANVEWIEQVLASLDGQ
jgi:hypothetical protein